MSLQIGTLQPSGRIIAVGRSLLACLFLLAVYIDSSQPTHAPSETYALLIIYVTWAIVLSIVTWRNWWLDARLAASAHVIDIAVFILMLYSTEGYTSPYFTFFVFLLLSSAIRWGWRETAATAGAVVLIYFVVSTLTAPAGIFDTERFVVRSGHLLILSAILIWFGLNQRAAWGWAGEPTEPVPVGGEPLLSALRVGMRGAGAETGTLFWRESGSTETSVTVLGPRGVKRSTMDSQAPSWPTKDTLYDIAKQRALCLDERARWRFMEAGQVIPNEIIEAGNLAEGLAVPVTAQTGRGIAFLEDVRHLSTDHLEIGRRVGREVAAHLQAAAVLAAAEESSMAKARVSVARDLHDSVVQFLAGIGFRLEAITRSAAGHDELRSKLVDLKQIVLAEQGELRDFVEALRTGGSVPVADLERDIAALCKRLAQQWNIECDAALEVDNRIIPVRLQLDIQQLIREGIANAVRHGKAKRVAVHLRTDGIHLCLTVEDDGSGFPTSLKPANPPASLAGRVKEVGGELTVQSALGKTSIFMRLPVLVQ